MAQHVRPGHSTLNVTKFVCTLTPPLLPTTVSLRPSGHLAVAAMAKRKRDPVPEAGDAAQAKRVRLQPNVTPVQFEQGPGDHPAAEVGSGKDQTATCEERNNRQELSGAHEGDRKTSTHSVRKLVPPRPFPTVPVSVSATGPRSAHNEGKNYICITRRTDLAAYMRRCKDVLLKDG